MNERETILTQIRRAIAVPAPKPGHPHLSSSAKEDATSRPEVHQLLPLVGAPFDDQLVLFQKHALDLRAEFHLVNSAADLHANLARLSVVEGWRKVASHGGPLTDPACRVLNLPVCRTDTGYPVEELETCDAGITECDALIAQTGSVLLTSRSAGGRALSVLPPHHVVLARREQLLPGLPEAFALLKQKYAPDFPSMISFITGPSRTGDIERILILGAHGPKRLTILCY